MTGTVTVEFKGGRELNAAIESLEITTARKRGLGRRALDVAAEPIKDEWQRGVDYDQGDLKRSIKIGNRASTRGTRAFRRGAGRDTVERYIGIDESQDDRGRLAIYSYIEEFGSEVEPANPAGRSAWETRKQEALDKLGDALWAEISKAARKAAK